MKKVLVLVLLALILTGCPDPTGPTQVAVVKNSNWDTVMTAEVALSGSRAIDSESLEAQVAAYNKANTDDQQVIYYDEAPEVEELPEAERSFIGKLLKAGYKARKGDCIPHVVAVYDDGEARAVDNFLKKHRAER